MSNNATKNAVSHPSTDSNEDELDLRDLIRIIWCYRKLILGIFLASLLIGAVISFATPPVYQVQAKISIGNFALEEQDNSQSQITPETAKEILLSNDLQEEAWGAETEIVSFNVMPVADTDILDVTLEINDPQQGEVLLNKLINLFNETAGEQYECSKKLFSNALQHTERELIEVNQSIKQTRDLLEKHSKAEFSSISEIQQVRLLDTLSRFTEQRDKLLEKKLDSEKKLNSMEGIKVLERPVASFLPVRPRKKLGMALAGVLGLMVGVIVAFTVDYFRRNPFVPGK